MDALTQLALDPKYHDILAILKGVRNGIVYGAKVRFPHALVMTFLFKSGPLPDKIRGIFKATKQHARNLGTFAFIYKTLLYLQKKLNGDKQADYHSFVAGLIGGYYVFGENNNINQQIVLYLFSRVVMALVKLPVKRQVIDAPQHTYPVFAAVVWGLVMWLFNKEGDTLQPSLRASMVYIYKDSDHWDSLRNLFWHNK
ncbi:peroxisomal membrane protein 4 [Hesseltinella vesiculosa]|uniref:Peroxisomal membrane protein 4 n=1 Tax=Hesseltinella vesiculosa TaxID=101127 RepID=A0A1X2GML0_9FUNG|nr:peroxisomal membrane protein 4 [Hesseltinella vesiculosa]